MPIRFEPFAVDTANGRLLKFGVRVPLREQAFQVLVALLARPGDTVSRQELRQRLWSDATTVDFEAGLNTAISRLRDALGDEPESPRYIETVPKRGYRFIGTLARQTSVAVMPLEHASAGGDQDFLAEGFADEVIRIVSRFEGIRVCSRTAVSRLKDQRYDPVRTARELGVSHLIEGSLRRIGTEVRIHLHLVNGEDGFTIWSERFDGRCEEIFSLQDRVGDALALAMKARLLPQQPQMRPTSAAAYLSYLKGHYLVARHALARALEHFAEAVELDPGYALPYHGAAVAHILRALMGQHPAARELSNAETSLAKGLEIGPSLSLMQNTLGMLRMFQWRWSEAQQAYEHALEIEPDAAYAHMMFAIHHSFRARHNRALEHAKRALLLEPLDPMTNFRLVQCLYYARDYDAAIEAGRSAMELAPGFASTRFYLALALLENGRAAEASRTASEAGGLESESPVYAGLAGFVAGRAGLRSEAETILDGLVRQRAAAYCPALPIAWVSLGLKDLDNSMRWLQTSYEEREPYLASALVFPGYDPLRSLTAFQAIVDGIRRPSSPGETPPSAAASADQPSSPNR